MTFQGVRPPKKLIWEIIVTLLYTVTPREIHKVTQNLKPKNKGVDGIRIETIKNLEEFILDPLFHIINTSIGLAVWPVALKCAAIKPIFKEKSKLIQNNYRRMSLISNLAKIIEKMIFNRIFPFVIKNKIIA